MYGAADHTLEYLLAFDGRIHWYEGGYYIKFAIKAVEATEKRPHGLRYAFTLHDPNGKRLMGFDNAHGVAAKGSRFKKAPPAADHWHRTAGDRGEPYEFKDAETLLDDFFDEVERILGERGIPLDVVTDDDERT